MSSTFGTLCDYTTGTPLHPANAEEWRYTALVVNGTAPGGETGAWQDDDGRAVWVDGGPEVRVVDADIRYLEQEAGQAGDTAQAGLCRAALDGDEGARAECVRIIIDNRINTAGE